MCGLVGILGGFAAFDLMDLVASMRAAISHRGPDDEGAFLDQDQAVAFGHRRLAVQDLSPSGAQPMHSRSGRYVIAFNGEIYNHDDVRKVLDAEPFAGAPDAWRGTSDTETVLAALEKWGAEEALQRFRGMFAFALWDRERRELTLARDRLGEKPLYYGWSGGAFLFGSDLAALEAFPDFDRPVDRRALRGLLRYGYIPAPRSIYRDVYKLEPGCLLVIRREATAAAPERTPSSGDACSGFSLRRWFSLPETIETALQSPIGDDQAAGAACLDALRTATRRQMLSDVPLGAFLSGGIDSSLIVALMQAASERPVNTFSIGFQDSGLDEARHAEKVAAHLGTHHTELYVTEQDALDVVPRLAGIYSEPFADSSQVPTWLVSRLAREHVTVALTGDGGDELFGGYNRYRWAPKAWAAVSRLPGGLRGGMTWAAAVTAGAGPVASALQTLGGIAQPGEKLAKLADRARHADTLEQFYLALASVNVRAHELVLAAERDAPRDWMAEIPALEPEHRMMYADAMSYLPDDILCKVDRAAMAISLETRVPFLDPDVVALAWRLPLRLKIRNGETKWILRRLLERFVPRGLFERPKQGFAVPLDAWLRGPLREWAEALLGERLLASQGFLDAIRVRALWDDHQRGRGSYAHALWPVLMFQGWLETREVRH